MSMSGSQARNLKEALNPEKALIFRITHRENIPWLLKNGLRCSSSDTRDPGFVSIGNPELIDKRAAREVPIAPGGTLADYIPFYFTPFSPMLYNIKTGYWGVTERANEEIVILVSSLREIDLSGIPFVFSDRHAYLQASQFSADLADLNLIPWDALQQRDFTRDPEDPSKFERYQAEALIHQHLPASELLGICCYDEEAESSVQKEVNASDETCQVIVRKGWYFE